MNNVSIGWVLILVGVICWILTAIGFSVAVDLWILGWAFVVAGALLFNGAPLRR